MYEPPTTDHRSTPVHRLARRRPITMFLVISLGLSWPVMIALLASGQDVSPGILLMVIFLLGAATLVTALSEGRAGVRRLFAGAIRWRMGLARFVVLVAAMPMLTLLVGLLTGSLQSPTDGWLALVRSYLFQTFIFGLLIVNCGGNGLGRLRAKPTHGASRTTDRIVHTGSPFDATTSVEFAEQGWNAPHGRGRAELRQDRSRCAILRDLIGDTTKIAAGSLPWSAARGVQRRREERSPGGWQYIPAMIVWTFISSRIAGCAAVHSPVAMLGH